MFIFIVFRGLENPASSLQCLVLMLLLLFNFEWCHIQIQTHCEGGKWRPWGEATSHGRGGIPRLGLWGLRGDFLVLLKVIYPKLLKNYPNWQGTKHCFFPPFVRMLSAWEQGTNPWASTDLLFTTRSNSHDGWRRWRYGLDTSYLLFSLNVSQKKVAQHQLLPKNILSLTTAEAWSLSHTSVIRDTWSLRLEIWPRKWCVGFVQQNKWDHLR